MPEKTKKISEQLVMHLKEIFQSELYKIILFGSYARGDYDSDSDIDIMVLLNSGKRNLTVFDTVIASLISDYCINYDVLFTIILRERQQFDEYSDVLPFYKNVLKEGIILYE
ncbi:MAG: nucleotidyltransferase domain-containing protein [Ignavibacteriae bacterium]|nr:nucleotidyltransferase domain-containing protein [Ignavibacteriota bacterium]